MPVSGPWGWLSRAAVAGSGWGGKGWLRAGSHTGQVPALCSAREAWTGRGPWPWGGERRPQPQGDGTLPVGSEPSGGAPGPRAPGRSPRPSAVSSSGWQLGRGSEKHRCRQDTAGERDVTGARGLLLRGPCLLAGPQHLSP